MTPQLQVISDELDRIELLDVTFKDNAIRDINALVLEFKKPKKFTVLVRDVADHFFTNPVLRKPIVLTAKTYGLKEFVSDVYVLDYFLLRTPFDVNIPAGDNVIETNNGYLLSADFVFIGNRIYEVDKCHTGGNRLTLTEPVEYADIHIAVAYRGKVSFPLKAELRHRIRDSYFNGVCTVGKLNKLVEASVLLDSLLPNDGEERKLSNVLNLIKRELQ